MKEENRRKLNKRNSDNMAIKISMIILGILLIFVITLYAINIFSGNKSKPSVRETEKETVKETIKETEKETEKETAKETEKETVEETEKETEKETVKETEAESEASGQEEQNKPEQPEQPEQNQPEQPVEEPSEPSQIPVPDYEPTVNISIDTIRNASQSEIVDMIIRGELGYGAERLDLLQKAGKDYNFYNNLVDQRLKELGY